MRVRPSWFALALLAGQAACGGGTEPGTAPPPGQSAASLTIAAGDGQTGQPGAAVTVKPSVRVRDAQGYGVAGATVDFVVEAGGGSIQQASVKTAADGTASPGDWILGASEGENRLRANTGSLPPVVITAQGRHTVIMLADTTIGVGGGTITYRKAGDPLDGLQLRIPASAYSTASHWTITARPSQAAPAMRFGRQVGSVLEIVSDQTGYADSLLELRVPHARVAGEFAMLFAWDKASGQLEALPLAGESATELTAVARHFNPALIVGAAPPPAGAARVTGGSAVQFVGGMYVFIGTSGHQLLEQPTSSGFIPGSDDWEFPNYGSYMQPDGHCSGQSVSALWYYLTNYLPQPGLGHLFGNLDALTSFWPDNPLGYRFASWVQEQIDWHKVDQSIRQMAAIGERNGESSDRLYYYSLAFALRATGEPQMVHVDEILPNGQFNTGHALVAYASERTKIWVADPNFPGEVRGIVFLNDKLGPYTSKPNAGAGDTQYNRISFQSQSFIIPVSTAAAGWAEVQNGTIGDGWFPAYRLEYRDSVANVWRTLSDTLTAYQGELDVRTICGQCLGELAGGGVNKQQPTWLVDATGSDIGYSLAVSGVTVPLAGGNTRFGAVVLGLPAANATPNADDQYIDFRWINVKSLRFTLTPAHTSPQAGTTVDFVSHPMGGAPPGAHYVWDFGDGSAIVDRVADSTASHKYTASGFYTVTVTLKNAAGRVFAQARATVLAGQIGIQPNPGNTAVNTPLLLTARSSAPGLRSPLRYRWDFGDGTTLQVLGDSTALHSWTAAGTYTVTVLLEDPVTGAAEGQAIGQVIVGLSFTQVSAGGDHACGLTAAGAAWCWGRNQFGQVGDGTSSTTTFRLRPVPVTGGHAFSQIAVGYEHTCGLDQAGALWCWGRNTWGQLGIGSADIVGASVPHPTPLQVTGIPPLASVTAGLDYTCARSAGGQAWCWGRADFGTLGEGTSGGNVYRSSPVQVLGGLSFAQLSAGFERTCGVTTSGSAYCWGYNGGANTGWGIDDYGDPPGILGVGSLATFVAQPAQVTGATQWAEVSANFRFACGRTTAGTLFCWGANTVQSAGGGQLGNGTMVTSTQPVPTSTGALSFTRVAAGNHSACALSAAGEAWCWGVSINGEVGDGGPVGVATSYPTPIKVVGGHIFTKLSVGFQMACGITAAGETWCWGANFRGNLGDGTTISRSTPVKIVP